MNVNNLIKDFISNGFVSYQELPPVYKNLLLAAHMQYLGTDSFNEIDLNALMLHHTKNYIATGRNESAKDLAETIKKQIEESFRDHLANTFEEIFCEREVEILLDHGFKPTKDPVTGETLYIK